MPAATHAEHFAIPGSALDNNVPQIGIHQQAQSNGTDVGPSTMDHSTSDGYTFASQDPKMTPDMNGVPADVYPLAAFDFPFQLESSLFHSAATGGMNFPEPMILPQLCSENAGKTSKCDRDANSKG